MIKNFEFLSEVAVNFDGRAYDLHNDYAFDGFWLNSKENSVTLKWTRRADNEAYLHIEFTGLEFFKASGIDLGMPRKEDACLDFLGRLNPADVDIMDGFLPGYSDANAHVIFSFSGGLALKLYSVSAKISVGNVGSF